MSTHAQRLHQAHVHAVKLADAASDAASKWQRGDAYLKTYQREMEAFAKLEAMRTPAQIRQEALK